MVNTVEFYSYPGDDHNIANSFGLAMQRSIQFLDKSPARKDWDADFRR